MKPSLEQVVERKQLKQKFYHNKSQVERSYGVNEPVRVRITDRGFGLQIVESGGCLVLKVDGSRWYLVHVGGSTRRAHADHLMGAFDHKNKSADFVDSFEEGNCSLEKDFKARMDSRSLVKAVEMDLFH